MAEEHVKCNTGKRCCIIKSMSSIIEFISLKMDLRSEGIERVSKR